MPRSEQHHRRDRDRDLVTVEPVDGRGRVLRRRGDRHGNGEHIVDEQSARDGQSRGHAEVDRCYLVVTAAARVGVHVLPVGRDDDEHDQGDSDADLPGVRVGREPGDAEREEDLVRRIGNRRKGVTGEHREGDPLGQEGLVQTVAAHGSTEQDPLERFGRLWHKVEC
jgi:hypothetical protein